jgi:hypothetical protein
MPTAARTNRTRKKGPNLFLRSLASTGNVGLSCKAAGIARSTAYEWRKDEEFAKGWESALEEASDVLEAEARRRGAEGVEEPVFYQGEDVGTVRKYSDVLLIFLLKSANRRRFDPDGYVKLSVHEDLDAKLKALVARMDEHSARRVLQ